jgi:monoamine oxidase
MFVERCDVAVLGAGLAGLCAARDLTLAGLDVIVLEARERVGGRTYTVPFEAAGCHVDLGAEWVAPAHHLALMRELSRYGIALEPEADTTEQNEPDALRVLGMTLVSSLEAAASELNPQQSN